MSENTTAQQIREIAAEGGDIRRRVRDVIVDAARERKLDKDTVVTLARDTLHGAGEAVNDALPEDPDSVLRKVVDGLADGLAVAAQATQLAIEEARSEGQRFADEDLADARESFKAIEETFVDTVRETTSAVGGQVAGRARDLATHAGRALQVLAPSVASAVKAAASDPVSLAGQSASAGVSVTRRTTGALFSAMSGLLQGAADLVDPGHDRDRDGSGNEAS